MRPWEPRSRLPAAVSTEEIASGRASARRLAVPDVPDDSVRTVSQAHPGGTGLGRRPARGADCTGQIAL